MESPQYKKFWTGGGGGWGSTGWSECPKLLIFWEGLSKNQLSEPKEASKFQGGEEVGGSRGSDNV
jgi:hypothetical protein